MCPGNASKEILEWKDAYTIVAHQMNALLKACPRKALLACSTVNPRHPLPNDHLRLIDSIMNQSGSYITNRPSAISMFGAFIRSGIYSVRETARIIYLRICFHTNISQVLGKSASILMKTWIFSVPKEVGSDFYFGSLQRLLKEKGIDSILIIGNAGKATTRKFIQGILLPDLTAIPELALVPIWGPIAGLFNQVWTSIELLKLIRNSKNPLYTRVVNFARLECLKPSTQKSLLHYYIAKRAVEVWRPKIYTTLYEGQPWEKVAWLGVKAASPECLLMGYQHSVIMPHAWGLINPHVNSWEFPAPQVVLTLGPITECAMKQGHQALGTEFITFGSFRRLKNEALPGIPSPSKRVVLVVPEGLMVEAKLLFERAIQAAKLLPDHHFIFRCHPVLPFERIKFQLSTDITDLPNVEVSNRSVIEEDFLRSSALLYRGTSVVIYAILMGLKPFYLNEPAHPFVDPLFQLEVWKESVKSVRQLARSLRKFSNLESDAAQCELDPAKLFVDQYSIPVNEAAISRIKELIMRP